MTMEAVQKYLAPTRLEQALAALGMPGGATVLAGGTDLMPQTHAGRILPAATLLNIRRIEGLDAIEVDGDYLVLGTLVSIERLRFDPVVARHAPLLTEAAEHFASEQIRNAGTLGGNLCNASPAGDTLTPLLALDAEVELAALSGAGTVQRRRVPIGAFFAGPGRTTRNADELLVAVRVPVAARETVWRYAKAGTRPALDISTIAVALAARRAGDARLIDVRLALGAVGPTPLRSAGAEALLEGQVLDVARARAAAEAAAADARPIDDVRASGWYRRELVRNLTQRMLDDVARN